MYSLRETVQPATNGDGMPSSVLVSKAFWDVGVSGLMQEIVLRGVQADSQPNLKVLPFQPACLPP